MTKTRFKEQGKVLITAGCPNCGRKDSVLLDEDLNERIRKLEKDSGLLHDSIEHWIDDVLNGTKDINILETCSLCGVYYLDEVECNGCPIKEKTGVPFCKESPGPNAGIRYSMLSPEEYSNKPQNVKDAINKEIDFLRSVKEKNDFKLKELIKQKQKTCESCDTEFIVDLSQGSFRSIPKENE